jgi:hypothetical protein
MAKRGFGLLPKRWGVERSFAWAARFRRRARDYERLDTCLKGFHYIAFTCNEMQPRNRFHSADVKGLIRAEGGLEGFKLV